MAAAQPAKELHTFAFSNFEVMAIASTTFNTSNTVDNYNEFNDVYEKAEEGTFEYDYGNSSSGSFFSTFMNFIFSI